MKKIIAFISVFCIVFVTFATPALAESLTAPPFYEIAKDQGIDVYNSGNYIVVTSKQFYYFYDFNSSYGTSVSASSATAPSISWTTNPWGYVYKINRTNPYTANNWERLNAGPLMTRDFFRYTHSADEYIAWSSADVFNTVDNNSI